MDFLLLHSLKFQLVSGKMMVTLEDVSSFGSSTLRMIYHHETLLLGYARVSFLPIFVTIQLYLPLILDPLPRQLEQPRLAQASTKEKFDIEGIWKTRFMRSLAAMDRYYRPVVLVFFWS